VKVAFETLYRRVMAGHVESASALPPGKHPEFLEAILLAEDSEKAKIDRLAMNELLIAVARDETLHAFSIQLRYLRGRTSRHYFAALLGSDSLASPLDAAILSNLLMGIDHSCIGLGAAARLDVLHRGLQEIEKLLAIAAD
jgi:hypothetical protein